MLLIARKWVGTEQPSFEAKHRQCKQTKVEIQARDVSDIGEIIDQALCITC